MRHLLLFCSFVLFQLDCNILGMEAPLQNNKKPIAITDNLEIYVNLHDQFKNKTLLIDTLSPFDISATTLSRKTWGEVNTENQLNIIDNPINFEKVDNKLHTAFHVHEEDKKNEGIAIKLSYDPVTKKMESYTYEVKNVVTPSLLRKETIEIPVTGNKIAMVIFNIDVINDKWSQTQINISKQERNKSLPPVPSNDNTSSKQKYPKWQFWKK